MASNIQLILPLFSAAAAATTPPPVFCGKYTEDPKQFLIDLQKYAESVYSWDRARLLNGMSVFLRDSALEWYCQLRMSHRRPHTWMEFVDLFLAQFNTPLRRARREQEWHDCWQRANENISEFLLRLRTLWREQEPEGTDKDLVQHLLRRMRSDLSRMIQISLNASLDEVISETQKMEGILRRRAEEEQLAKRMTQSSSSDIQTRSSITILHPSTSTQSIDHQIASTSTLTGSIVPTSSARDANALVSCCRRENDDRQSTASCTNTSEEFPVACTNVPENITYDQCCLFHDEKVFGCGPTTHRK